MTLPGSPNLGGTPGFFGWRVLGRRVPALAALLWAAAPLGCASAGGAESSAASGESAQRGAAERDDSGGDAASAADDGESADGGAEARGRPRPEDARIPVPPGAQPEVSLAGPGESRLEVYHVEPESHDFCDPPPHRLVRLVDERGVLDDKLFASECTGACTEEAKERGRERRAEIEALIEEGEATTSQLDYNFTECIEMGHRVAVAFDELQRPLLVLESDELGPHDQIYPEARLITAGCAEVQVSEAFENPSWPAHTQDFTEIEVAASQGGEDVRFVLEMPDVGTVRDDPEAEPMAPMMEAVFDTGECEWNLEMLR